MRCAIPGRRKEGTQLTHRHPGLAPGPNKKATKPNTTPKPRHPGLVPGPSGLAPGTKQKGNDVKTTQNNKHQIKLGTTFAQYSKTITCPTQ